VRKLGYVVAAIVGLYAVLVLATSAPDVTFWLGVAVVVATDGFLLRLVARRRSRAAAVWCAVVAVSAAIGQAIWVWVPIRWNLLPADGSGDLTWFGSALVVALIVGFLLLVRRRTYPFGWAVILGSAQGFAVSFLTLLALLAAALGGD
jgi:hypothetical protein